MLKHLKRLVVFRDKDHIHFSFKGFISSYTIQSLVLMYLILKGYEYFSPTIHSAQFESPGWQKLLVFLAMHLFLAFFEWGYHRYVLHMFILKPLRSQYEEHEKHHHLTRPSKGDYPITESHQTESSTFPFYALAVFWLFFGVFLAVIQAIFKEYPIIRFSL